MSSNMITLFERMLRDFRVGQPVIVVAVKQDGALVDVQPVIQDKKAIDGREFESEDKKIIIDVPVDHDSNQCAGSFAKILEGDHGYIINFDYDIKLYNDTAELAPPPSERTHDYNDCVYLPRDWCFARRASFDQKYDYQIANLDGSAGVGINATGIHLWGDLITFNGMPLETLNAGTGPFSYATALPPNTGLPFPNRRKE